MNDTSATAEKTIDERPVIYSEALEEGLFFNIVLTYQPFHDGKVRDLQQNSSQMICRAIISNDPDSTEELKFIEKAEGSFNELRELKTNMGYRVWQQDYGYSEQNFSGKKLRMRKVLWMVEVPKNDMLRFLNMNEFVEKSS